jgi:hypothetical protein
LALSLVCLIVLEICARLDDWIKWNAPLLGNYSRESLTLVDSIGLRNRPNAQYEKWKINSFGFRGGEIEKKTPEGVIRIMILGASEAFGLYETPGKEFPAQLHELLNQWHPGRFEVINAAVPGLSPPRILQLYVNWLGDFEPDLVIYYPSFSGYLMRNSPTSVRFDGDEQALIRGFNFRIMAKTATALKRFLPNELQTAIKKILIEQEVARHPADWVFNSLPPDRPRLFKRQLLELVHSIQNSGARVILATHAIGITNPISEKEQQILIGWRKLYPHVAENTFLEMEQIGNDVIKQVAESTQSDFVEINGGLLKNRENFADHVHFTTAGAKAVAELMAKAVTQFVIP